MCRLVHNGNISSRKLKLKLTANRRDKRNRHRQRYQCYTKKQLFLVYGNNDRSRRISCTRTTIKTATHKQNARRLHILSNRTDSRLSFSLPPSLSVSPLFCLAFFLTYLRHKSPRLFIHMHMLYRNLIMLRLVFCVSLFFFLSSFFFVFFFRFHFTFFLFDITYTYGSTCAE